MDSRIKKEIQRWWDTNPMDYMVQSQIGTQKFFREIDRQVYEDHPFFQNGYPIGSKLIKYADYVGKRVLEIGCGMGTMAQQFAEQGAKVTAIDLTAKAVEMTKKRFAIFGLSANIQHADAEDLPFKNESFDIVFSLGVLHHTPDTSRAINEIHRVLKYAGEAIVMLYNRDSLHFFYHHWLVGGILNMDRHFLSRQQLDNRYTDGAEKGLLGNPHTKVYKRKEALSLFKGFTKVRSSLYGLAVLKSMFPRDAKFVPTFLIRHYERRFGFFNFITATK